MDNPRKLRLSRIERGLDLDEQKAFKKFQAAYRQRDYDAMHQSFEGLLDLMHHNEGTLSLLNRLWEAYEQH